MITVIAGTMAEEKAKPIIATPASTAIKLIEWDPQTKVMRVTFASGSQVYDHPNVEREDVEAFVNSPSPGRYWIEKFKRS